MWAKFRLAFFSFFSTLIELPKQLPLRGNNRSIPPELPTSQPEQPSAVSSETEQQPPLPMIQQQQPVNNHHDELAMQLPLWRTNRSIPPELPTIRPERPRAVSSDELAMRLPLWRTNRSIPPELPTIRPERPRTVSSDELAMQLPLWRTNRSIPPELPTIRPERPRTVSSDELIMQLPLWRTNRSIPPELPTIRPERPRTVSSDELSMQLPLWRTNRSIPPELPTIRPERPRTVSSETERMQQQQPPQPMFQRQQPVDNHHDRAQIDDIINGQWALVVVGACFAAISVILQAQQTRATLPASSFPWFCVVLALAFLALLASVYMRRHYHRASRVFEHVAIFFCAVALLLAIWMTLKSKS